MRELTDRTLSEASVALVPFKTRTGSLRGAKTSSSEGVPIAKGSR